MLYRRGAYDKTLTLGGGCGSARDLWRGGTFGGELHLTSSNYPIQTVHHWLLTTPRLAERTQGSQAYLITEPASIS
jgi:hypothetical protein